MSINHINDYSENMKQHKKKREYWGECHEGVKVKRSLCRVILKKVAGLGGGWGWV